jgi:hypothetical protein
MSKIRQENNQYFITKRRAFDGKSIPENAVLKSIDFAYEMCFGDGHHRNQRSGGIASRNALELFGNTFQGKLAELCAHDFFTKSGLVCSEIDFGIYEKNIWDDTDLIINDKKISIKSASFFSNLLLLESKDWNASGAYIPNIDTDKNEFYDYFILVRIKEDIKNILKTDEISTEKNDLINLITSYEWTYDIAGWMSHITLMHLIKNNYILPQQALLNGKIKMDATNYYIQSGDMREIEELFRVI